MSNGSRDKGRISAQEENQRQKELQTWLTKTAGAKIKAVLEDAALPFIDHDIGDEQLVGSFDLTSEYDPIIEMGTNSRLLSEEIKHAAATLCISPKRLKDLLDIRFKEIWSNHPKKFPNEPTGTLYGRSFLVSRHGVWVRQAVAGLDDLPIWRRIAKTQIDLESMSRAPTRPYNWQHRYFISNETGKFPVDIAHEETGKDAVAAIKRLMRHGVHVVESKEARKLLAKFLQIWPSKRIIRASSTGWFEWRGHRVFVLPDEVLGATDKMHVILDRTTRSDNYGFHRVGTSEQWRQYIAVPLARNSNVVLAVGVFLAGPLLHWSDEPPGGYHSWGRSSIGKTLAAAVGQSLYGRPYKRGAKSGAFGFTWESTANKHEQRAVLRNDVGLGLDEIGIGDKNSIATAIYKLAGGLGKGRMNQDELDFNILFYSTGEVSLAKFLRNVQPGQMVRLADVPAEVQPESAFETISKKEIFSESRKFYDLMDEYHGSAGYEYLQHLVTLTPKEIKARVKKGRALFLARPEVIEIIERTDQQVTSVAGRFALLAVALAIAVEAGILPWTVADTDAGIISCMRRWLNQRGNLDEAGELLREIERRRRVFAVSAEDRLIRLDIVRGQIVAASPADQHKLEAADQFEGYVKGDRILLPSATWQKLWTDLDVDAVNKHLSNRGLLIVGRDGKFSSAERYKAGAQATRFYVLTLAFIDRG